MIMQLSKTLTGKKNRKQWGFDGVAGPTLDQESMFRIVAEQTCKDVLNGYNGTIFVYGQTGSGKTYTMYGAEDKPDDVSLMGVIPRCVSYIFNKINEDKDIDTFRVSCSFFEIYQERLRDLLNSKKNQDLKIRLNKRHETYVQGLVEHQVESITVVKLKDGTIRIGAANFANVQAKIRDKENVVFIDDIIIKIMQLLLSLLSLHSITIVQQIYIECNKFMKVLGNIPIVSVYGGVSISEQINKINTDRSPSSSPQSKAPLQSQLLLKEKIQQKVFQQH
eukprot:167289_1